MTNVVGVWYNRYIATKQHQLNEREQMTQTLVAVEVATLITELAEVRSQKADLSKRESQIRNEVLSTTGKVDTEIFDPSTGEAIAEIVMSERRSITDWETFQLAFPEAYQALVKFTEVATLNLK